MSKKLKIGVAVAVSVMVLLIDTAIGGIAQGASPDPVLSIDYSNLSFCETVYLKYAVKAENVSDTDAIKLKVWRETAYLVGGEAEAVLSPVGTEVITRSNI